MTTVCKVCGKPLVGQGSSKSVCEDCREGSDPFAFDTHQVIEIVDGVDRVRARDESVLPVRAEGKRPRPRPVYADEEGLDLDTPVFGLPALRDKIEAPKAVPVEAVRATAAPRPPEPMPTKSSLDAPVLSEDSTEDLAEDLDEFDEHSDRLEEAPSGPEDRISETVHDEERAEEFAEKELESEDWSDDDELDTDEPENEPRDSSASAPTPASASDTAGDATASASSVDEDLASGSDAIDQDEDEGEDSGHYRDADEDSADEDSADEDSDEESSDTDHVERVPAQGRNRGMGDDRSKRQRTESRKRGETDKSRPARGTTGKSRRGPGADSPEAEAPIPLWRNTTFLLRLIFLVLLPMVGLVLVILMRADVIKSPFAEERIQITNVRDWAAEWAKLQKRVEDAKKTTYEDGMRAHRGWKNGDPPDPALRDQAIEILQSFVHELEGLIHEGSEILEANQTDLKEHKGYTPEEAASKTEQFDTELARWKYEKMDVARLVGELTTPPPDED